MNKSILDLKEVLAIDDSLTFLQRLVIWLRPDKSDQVQEVEARIQLLVDTMNADPGQADMLRAKLCKFLTTLRFLPLCCDVGILPRRGFASELNRRLYNMIMPEPPIIFSAKKSC